MTDYAAVIGIKYDQADQTATITGHLAAECPAEIAAFVDAIINAFNRMATSELQEPA